MAGLSDILGSIDAPKQPKNSGGGGGAPKPKPKNPGPVPVRGNNWDFDRGSYVLEYGDTLAGLAATYLGNAARWGEIWAEQPGEKRLNGNPNKLIAGESIRMPQQAIDNAHQLLKKPGSTVGPNGKVTGPNGAGDEMPGWQKVALGVGGLAAVGALGYGAYRVLA